MRGRREGERETKNEPSDGNDDSLVLRDILDRVSPLSSELQIREASKMSSELLDHDEEGRKVDARSRRDQTKRTFKAVSTASAPVFMGRTISERTRPSSMSVSARALRKPKEEGREGRGSNSPYPNISVIFLEKGPKLEL